MTFSPSFPRRTGVCAALLLAALSGQALAATCALDIGTLGTTAFTCEVSKSSNGLFLDTVNFNVEDPNTTVTITSTTEGIQFFTLPIFENDTDSEYVGDNDGQHIDVDLAEFAVPGPGYHVHPQGLIQGGTGNYALTFTAAAPVPEPETYAMLLAGLGLVGFAVRRRRT